jgi:hypothetical protein
MNDLAILMYKVLYQLPVRSTWPIITYSQLLLQLPRSYHSLSPRTPEFHEALRGIVIACRNRNPKLPALSAIAVSSKSLQPGAGYFMAAHPEIPLLGPKNVQDWWQRLEIESARTDAWRAEVGRVVGTKYPSVL